MKNKIPYIASIILIMGSAFFLIQDAKATGLATVSVPTTISSSTTWLNGYVYIISASGTTINNGATVSVDPGAIIKLATISSTLTISGGLDVNGTTTSPVYFTSYKDDSAGGDSNSDGSSSGSAFNWKYINIASGGRAEMDNAIVRYGGYGSNAIINSNQGTLDLQNSTISNSYYGVRQLGTGVSSTISNSIISGNSRYGITVQDGYITLSNSIIDGNASRGVSIDSGADSVSINNSNFTDNTDYAIYLNSAVSDSGHFTESNNTASGSNINGIYILTGSTATGNITWPKTSIPYVLSGNITVPQNATLSVNPGAVIKFDPIAVSYITVNGALDVNGTSTQSVYFTSIHDDDADGLNTDNATISAGVGDWRYIMISSSPVGHADIDHAVVRYGGSGSVNGNIHNSGILNLTNSTISNSYNGFRQTVASASSTISNSVITDNSSQGMYVQAGSTDVSNSTISENGANGIYIYPNFANSFAVTNSNITNNGSYAIYLTPAAVSGNNSFSESGNTATGNNINGSYISAGTTTAGSKTWGMGSLPYVLDNVTIGSTTTISVDPGVIFKLATTSTTLTISNGGVLDVNGTTQSPVYFVALKDDVGGDTSGSEDLPQPGDWGDIYISSGGRAYLDHAIIRFGGGNTSGANIYNNGGTLVMNNSNSGHSSSDGIKQTGGTTTAKGVILERQAYGARVTGGSFEITDHSLFFVNDTYGIYNSSGNVINAINNHWNSTDGPGDVGPGNGDKITTNVNYDPWWGKERYILGRSAVNGTTNEIRYEATAAVTNAYGTELSNAIDAWEEDPPMGKVDIETDVASTSLNLNIVTTYVEDVDWYGKETLYDFDLPHDLAINTWNAGGLTSEQKKVVIIHELGHSLGLADSVDQNIMDGVVDENPDNWQMDFGQEDEDSYNTLYRP